jgi:hypothetical protein
MMAHMLGGKPIGECRTDDLLSEHEKEHFRRSNGELTAAENERYFAIEAILEARGAFRPG